MPYKAHHSNCMASRLPCLHLGHCRHFEACASSSSLSSWLSPDCTDTPDIINGGPTVQPSCKKLLRRHGAEACIFIGCHDVSMIEWSCQALVQKLLSSAHRLQAACGSTQMGTPCIGRADLVLATGLARVADGPAPQAQSLAAFLALCLLIRAGILKHHQVAALRPRAEELDALGDGCLHFQLQSPTDIHQHWKWAMMSTVVACGLAAQQSSGCSRQTTCRMGVRRVAP